MKTRLAMQKDKEWIKDSILKNWGSEFIVALGRKLFPTEESAVVAEDAAGNKLGLLTFKIENGACEILTFDAFEKHAGIGTVLLDFLKNEMRKEKCSRIWLITVNDNLNALRFYQKRGFSICGLHLNAVKEARKIKPSIPTLGDFGIPIEHELELEMTLS